MARKLLLCLAVCLAANAPLMAAEHAACTDPGYNWSRHTISELRHIASDCKSQLFSELNFHRAYYLDLIGESEANALLIQYARSDIKSDITAYIFNMVLIEQLAPFYFLSTAQQLSFLNSEYEINNEIAELRIRGYGNLASRLSRLNPPQD